MQLGHYPFSQNRDPHQYQSLRFPLHIQFPKLVGVRAVRYCCKVSGKGHQLVISAVFVLILLRESIQAVPLAQGSSFLWHWKILLDSCTTRWNSRVLGCSRADNCHSASAGEYVRSLTSLFQAQINSKFSRNRQNPWLLTPAWANVRL